MKSTKKGKAKKEDFTKDDYVVLTYEQLLKVNGAKGGGQSGPSGSPSGQTGSSSGQSAPASGGTSTSSSVDNGLKPGFVENSHEGVANAQVGDKITRNDGTVIVLNQGDINYAKDKIEKSQPSGNGGTTSGSTSSSNAGESSGNTSTENGSSSNNNGGSQGGTGSQQNNSQGGTSSRTPPESQNPPINKPSTTPSSSETGATSSSTKPTEEDNTVVDSPNTQTETEGTNPVDTPNMPEDNTDYDATEDEYSAEYSKKSIAKAQVGDTITLSDGSEHTLTENDIEWAKRPKQSDIKDIAARCKEIDPSNAIKNDWKNQFDENTTATEKIETIIDNLEYQEYKIVGTEIKKEDGTIVTVTEDYRCDNYVEEVLRLAGYDPADYCVDDPVGKGVDKHIEDLKKSGKEFYTDASTLTEGVYVVFMQDADFDKDGCRVKESHSAFLIVNEDGSAYIQDNSKKNNEVKYDDGTKKVFGGTEKTISGYYGKTSPKDICTSFTNYENYFFQKIQEKDF